jgi:hypothetical protein
LCDVIVGERDVRGADVLVEPVELGGARNGHNPSLLCEEPGERDLAWRDDLGRGDGLHFVDECHVALQRVRAEAWDLGAQVVTGPEGRRCVHRSGQESLGESAGGDEADAELLAGVQDVAA